MSSTASIITVFASAAFTLIVVAVVKRVAPKGASARVGGPGGAQPSGC